MNLRNRYERVSLDPGGHALVIWEPRAVQETVVTFRVQTTEEIKDVYVEQIALGNWVLATFRIPLEALLVRLGELFPPWRMGVNLSLALSNAGADPVTFAVRPVCVGDDKDAPS